MKTEPLEYTKAELLARIDKANDDYSHGRLVPGSVALAMIQGEHAAVPA